MRRLLRSRGGVSLFLWRDVFGWSFEDGPHHERWRGVIRIGLLCTLRRHR